jgi:hypothetical protein
VLSQKTFFPKKAQTRMASQVYIPELNNGDKKCRRSPEEQPTVVHVLNSSL